MKPEYDDGPLMVEIGLAILDGLSAKQARARAIEKLLKKKGQWTPAARAAAVQLQLNTSVGKHGPEIYAEAGLHGL